MEIKTVREAADELLKKIQQYKELWKKLEDNVSLSDKKMDAITRAEKTTLSYFKDAMAKAKDEIEKEKSFFFKKNIEMIEVVSTIENRIEKIKEACDSFKIQEFKYNLNKEVQMLRNEISDRSAEMEISVSEAFKASQEAKIFVQNSTEELFKKNIEMIEVVSTIENRIEKIKEACDSFKIQEFKYNLNKEVQMLRNEISDRSAEMEISVSEAFKASQESEILIQNSTEELFKAIKSFKAETMEVLANTQEETEKKFNKVEHKLKNYQIVTIVLALVNIIFSIWLYFKSGL